MMFAGDVLIKMCITFRNIKFTIGQKSINIFLQSNGISKGHHYIVSLQKGHLKVTRKRKSTYKNSIGA